MAGSGTGNAVIAFCRLLILLVNFCLTDAESLNSDKEKETRVLGSKVLTKSLNAVCNWEKLLPLILPEVSASSAIFKPPRQAWLPISGLAVTGVDGVSASEKYIKIDPITAKTQTAIRGRMKRRL